MRSAFIPPAAARAWEALVAREGGSLDLAAFLGGAWDRFSPGSVAALLGEALAMEDAGETSRYPHPLRLSAWRTVRTTRRVDGAVSFTIPAPAPAESLAAEVMREAGQRSLRLPSDEAAAAALEEDLAALLLAALHGRAITLNDRFDLRLKIECPVSAEGDRKRELMLMGHLPLGGRATLFYSSLPAARWLALDPAAAEFAARYEARRNPDRTLTLHETEADPRARQRIAAPPKPYLQKEAASGGSRPAPAPRQPADLPPPTHARRPGGGSASGRG